MTHYIFSAKLKARTALHIGSGRATDTTDALIRRDSMGVPLIPGTAVAGTLRSLLTRLAPRLDGTICNSLKAKKERENPCSCTVCQLFGDINPTDEENATSKASRLLVYNAKLVTANQSVIRDGVGIERGAGVAARAGAVKFDLELLPAETCFDLRLELRYPTPEVETLLAAGLAEWQVGRAWLGGRVARGLGAFTLEGLEVKHQDLNHATQLMAFLRGETSPAADSTWLSNRVSTISIVSSTEALPAISRQWVELTGTLQATGLLLINDTMQAGLSGFDHAPLLQKASEWQRPILSGSTIRGVLRSHAERLARTLTTRQALQVKTDEAEAAEEWFLQHCPACDPNARRLGRKIEEEKLPALESCDSLLLYSVGLDGNTYIESEKLCLACRLFGSSRWGSRFLVEDAPYHGSKRPTYKMLDFVAIDRFTGGGADKLKFDALALW
jgi:CRISPR/Cas system CSM-associated protein Csm3 (group 7 of RAMP superfamily)